MRLPGWVNAFKKERNVFVRMGLLKKKQDRTTEDFQRYWREHHAGLARKLPGLRGYVQNHIIDQMQRGITYQRGPEQLDGFPSSGSTTARPCVPRSPPTPAGRSSRTWA